MVTSHDVARLAGVSQPTVSRALAGSPRVSESTRARVQAAAAELGYVASATGRALSMGRSFRVGVLVTDLQNHFYPHVVGPLHLRLQELGYELVLLTEKSPGTDIAEVVRANGLDGIILTTVGADAHVPAQLRASRIPFVYFNRVNADVPADSVTVDPTNGMRDLAAAVKSNGHTRIGAIFGPASTSTGLLRSQVLRTELAAVGLELLPENTAEGEFSVASGAAGLARLMAHAPAPTAVICANDVVAIGALNAAADAGLSVPEDVSIVGFDDLPESRWPIIQLSTVRYALDQMSAKAADLLIRRIDLHKQDPEAEPEYVHEVFESTYLPRRTLGRA